MATRSDVVVDFTQSPRIAEVAAPSEELSVQDTVDTLRKQEDSFRGMSEVKLLDAAGKQNLGGGVAVGITAELQNIQLAFEARRTPAEQGTVTTGSAGDIKGELTFVDSAADFVAAEIVRGSLVINFTDRSIADVIRVDDANTLTTKVLVNGVTNTYQIGDTYQVFNIAQCEISGGNVVAYDDLALQISPVLPTAFTQIVRTSAVSAAIVSTGGLTPSQQQIRDAMMINRSAGTPGDLSVDKLLDDNPANVVAALASETYDGRSYADIIQDLLAMASGDIVEDPAGTFTVFERDGVTPRYVFKKYDNKRERQ